MRQVPLKDRYLSTSLRHFQQGASNLDSDTNLLDSVAMFNNNNHSTKNYLSIHHLFKNPFPVMFSSIRTTRSLRTSSGKHIKMAKDYCQLYH